MGTKASEAAESNDKLNWKQKVILFEKMCFFPNNFKLLSSRKVNCMSI
jgi:hypothetical protein